MPVIHPDMTINSHGWQGQLPQEIRFAGILAVICLILLSVPAQLLGQRVSVELTIPVQGLRLSPPTFETTSGEGTVMLRDRFNEPTGRLYGACLSITSPENIVVFTRAELQVSSENNQNMPNVTGTVRYINDGRPTCPTDIKTAMDVSRELSGRNQGTFALHRNGALRKNLTGLARSTTGFMYLIVEEEFNRRERGDQTTPRQESFKAHYVIDIEYL